MQIFWRGTNAKKKGNTGHCLCLIPVLAYKGPLKQLYGTQIFIRDTECSFWFYAYTPMCVSVYSAQYFPDFREEKNVRYTLFNIGD